jgi:hypothetical protein
MDGVGQNISNAIANPAQIPALIKCAFITFPHNIMKRPLSSGHLLEPKVPA